MDMLNLSIHLLLLFAYFLCFNIAEGALEINCESLQFNSPELVIPAPSDFEDPLDISELKDADGKYSYVPDRTYKCMIACRIAMMVAISPRVYLLQCT